VGILNVDDGLEKRFLMRDVAKHQSTASFSFKLDFNPGSQAMAIRPFLNRKGIVFR